MTERAGPQKRIDGDPKSLEPAFFADLPPRNRKCEKYGTEPRLESEWAKDRGQDLYLGLSPAARREERHPSGGTFAYRLNSSSAIPALFSIVFKMPVPRVFPS